MKRYELFLKKHIVAIITAALIALNIGLAVAFPYADIEIHHAEAVYEQD